MKWFIFALKNFDNFSGRARRKEYWYFVLFFLGFGIILTSTLSAVFGIGSDWVYRITSVYVVLMSVPGISVSIRRLHDADCKGFFLIFGIIPIGWILLFSIFALSGTPGRNRFGQDPRLII